MHKIAFFDVDNTIYNGYTAGDYIFSKDGDTRFQNFVNDYKQGIKDYRSAIISYHDISQLALDNVSQIVKGKSKEIVLPEFEAVLASKETIFNSWVRPVIKYLRRHKYKIILISAGFDFVNEFFVSVLKVDGHISTIIPQKNGKFTGEKTKIINGEEKVKAIKQYLKKDTFSIAFGDSIGDAPMLEAVDKAFVAYNEHHSEMIQFAKEKEWIIFKDSEEIIKSLINIQ